MVFNGNLWYIIKYKNKKEELRDVKTYEITNHRG